MKSIAIAISALTTSLASSVVFAHVGEHHHQGLMSGLLHLLSEHALPIVVIAVLAAGLLAKRHWRA